MRSLLTIAALVPVLAATIATASAQGYGEGRRYGNGNTASFFYYDNRDDQRDFPTNGVFPGNFATSPFFAGVGAAGWLGSNPQHQGAPYPSQSYTVNAHGIVACPRYRIEQAADGRRYSRCLAP
ncbi:MAG TPA: BA14K family protein [Bradyrhizobium sp.]|uniref:BA14K family protein n=1 Tax=Bradyrhizobium sp. TaxID=376 RepID=UPI002D8090C9|nr:BA14K family protein [Bradyrhizobium sp.]HET7888260.1 BA14K family protein [Bradyrhizobium sp.]